VWLWPAVQSAFDSPGNAWQGEPFIFSSLTEDLMSTATKAARGTKRTCQNSDCGARFYDLNRDPIICPHCEEKYVVAVASPSVAGADKGRRPAAKAPVYAAPDDVKPDDLPEGEEALVDIEAVEDAADGEADETFLEEEEDSGSDVSGIIGDSGESGDEQ